MTTANFSWYVCGSRPATEGADSAIFVRAGSHLDRCSEPIMLSPRLVEENGTNLLLVLFFSARRYGSNRSFAQLQV